MLKTTKIMRGTANRSFGIEVAELAGITKDVTSKAKQILKMLEKTQPLKRDELYEDKTAFENTVSETERIIKDLDLNNISPIQAFAILSDLYEKVSEKQ